MTKLARLCAVLVTVTATATLARADLPVAPAEPALFVEGASAVYQEPAPSIWDAREARAISETVAWRQAQQSPSRVMLTNACSEAGCVDLGCDSGCDNCGGLPWAHRTGVAGEFLYLRPRNAEVVYAVPIDGAIAPPAGVAPIQVGRMGMTDPDYSAGFRLAATWALDDCSSVVATYSRFSSDTNDLIGTNPPLVIRGMSLHPGTANAAADFLQASGNQGIDFSLCDLDYRFAWLSDCNYAVNIIGGVHYARLDQDFRALYTLAGSTETAQTDISFDGGGVRLGLDAERHHDSCGLFCYGKSDVNFVAGEFRARYLQGSSFDPVIVDTNWKAGRVVTMLDLELGVGWQSTCGTFRWSAGYLFNSWLNTVRTAEFIQAVQTNNMLGLGDTLTFDGFVTRAEIRF